MNVQSPVFLPFEVFDSRGICFQVTVSIDEETNKYRIVDDEKNEQEKDAQPSDKKDEKTPDGVQKDELKPNNGTVTARL